MATAASASFHLWMLSGGCLLSSHPPPALRTNIHKSCTRSSLHLSSSSSSSLTPFSSSSFSSNLSHHPYLPPTGARAGTHDHDDNNSNSSNSSSNDNNNNNNGDNNGGNSNRNPFNHGDDDDGSPFGYHLLAFHFSRGGEIVVHDKKHEKKLFGALLLLLSLLASSSHSRFLPQALAEALTRRLPEDDGDDDVAVWQVKGSKWIKLVSDASSQLDALFAGSGGASRFQLLTPWTQAARLFSQLMLPDGYPHSVTSDYLEYSLWRGIQGVAGQINGVLATQVPLSLPLPIPTLTSLLTFSSRFIPVPPFCLLFLLS